VGIQTTPQKDRVRLTEDGARALQAWCKRRDVTLMALSVVVGASNAMWGRRFLHRQGLATLEQVGAIVGFCGGEVSAAQLVGLDLATAVPVMPLRPLRRIGVQPMSAAPPVLGVVPGPAPTPAASAVTSGEVEVEVDEYGEPAPPTGSSRKTLEYLRDHARSQALRADCARRLMQSDADEDARHGGAPERAVRDSDLIEKFQTLLHNARRQWEQLTGTIGVPAAQAGATTAPAASAPDHGGAATRAADAG
jgi:hypothetical protein